MFNLVIFSVFFILKAEGNELESENPAVHIDYNYNSKDNYKALVGKPLQIFINNSYASEVWCSGAYSNNCAQYNGEHKYFVHERNLKIENVTILNITEVTAEMSTRWLCVVLQEYHGSINYKHENKDHTPKNLYFHLYVKAARSVNLTLNYSNLTYVTTNLSVSNDGAASYTYEDGEYVDFSCRQYSNKHRDSDCSSSEIRLEYYNAEDVRLFKTKSRDKGEQIFRSVLNSKSDKSYLDCIVNTESPKREYRYRTTFYMKKRADATQQVIKLYGNGQNLPIFKYKNVEKTSDSYIFKYIDGEVLNVTCRKMDDSKHGTLNFYFEKGNTEDLHTVIVNPEKEIIISNMSTSKIHDKTLACDIKNTNVQKPNAILLFSPEIPDNGIRIRGLPRNNVLYQYSNGLDEWTIEYQYSVNDTLNLTCVSKYGFHASSERRRSFQQSEEEQFQWKFKGHPIKSSAIRTSMESNIYFSNRTFTKTLDATDDGKKIQCVYYFPNIYSSKYVKIILCLKPELVSEVDSDELASGVDSRVRVLVPVGSVGVAAAIITMVCLAYWRKRSKRSNLIQNAYDNFSNQTDSPIPPFPKQWENDYDDSHYSKIDEGIMQENYSYATVGDEKLYRMPHKRQSNNTENHYSEIDEYIKPKTDGLATNWNNTLKGQATGSHHSKSNPITNTDDSKHGTYDKLRRSNLPFNKDLNVNNDTTGKKNKNVTFGPNLNLNQDGMNDRRVKQTSNSSYANTDEGIYMQPGDMQKKPKYENQFLQNERSDDAIDLDYAEPYSHFGVICKNDLYG